MNRILLSLFFLSLFSVSKNTIAQTFGNEWIDYSQTYYKFKVLQTGVHKLDFNSINAAGIPTNAFTSANIQVFGKEKELPLYIEDGGDNSLDSGDYILFYAEKNNGWLDSTLYKNSDQIANPAYSLYNDTIYYFFTWNSASNNKRFIKETDVDFNSYTPAPYINWFHEIEFHTAYFEGENLANSSTSFFNDLEGFSSTSAIGPSTYNFNIPTTFPYTGAGAPKPKVIANSYSSNNASNPNSVYNHHLKYFVGPSDSLLLDTLFAGVIGMQMKTTFGVNQLGNGVTSLKWNNVGDLPVASDRQGVTYLSLDYPKQPNLTGFTSGKFTLPNSSSGFKNRLDLTWNSSAPLFLSLGTIPRILTPVVSGGTIQVIVPNDANNNDQQVVFANSSNLIAVNSLSPVSTNGKFRNYLASPPDSAVLMVYHKSLATATNNYKTYRTSNAGGNHQVIDAETDELYLQFGGGVPKHINGIRRWAHYIYENSNRKPAALFLMGKGIREAIVYTVTASGGGTRSSSQIYAQSLVPSFGQPSSDVAITASLIPNNWTPLIPTGRISVNTNDELQNYLDKVIDQELEIDSTSTYHSDTKDWQKQVLHFAGGSTATEQALFRFYVEQMEDKIEASNFGGNVTRIYKNNSTPLDPTTYSEISDRLASGVSLMNFFGHANSQTSGFEINIDEPENWNNKGKYPLVIANTCYNGNIFYHENSGFSTSEKFVRASNSGAIGFISAVSLGFSGPLANYTNKLYDEISQYSYGASIGKQIQATISKLPYDSTLSGLLNETTALQMTFNGDPMVKLNWHTKPEIELLSQNVSFGPSLIDLSVDSISVQIELTNLGRSINDSIAIEVKRNFPESGMDSLYRKYLPELHYKQVVTFKMPLQANIGIGLNQFTISADIPSFTEEVFDEFNNNQITKNLIINIDGIQPVSPTEFAVVPKDSVVLKGSTIDPLASIKTYRFEIDTTDLFNSPEHRYQEITSVGGTKEAFPADWLLNSNNTSSPLICVDSTVYFWRLALVEPNLEWKERSFQYITTKTGWGQDHFFQFEDNTFNALDYNRPTRSKNFTIGDTSWLEAIVGGTNFSTSHNQWLVNNTQQDYDLCTVTPSLHVGVVDPLTFESWGTRWVNTQGDTLNPTHGFGNANELNSCRTRVEKYFIFRQNNLSSLQAFQNMVNNEVPNGHYIVVYAPRSGAQYSAWNTMDSAGMFGTFANLGSTGINPNLPTAPMAFFVKKGDPSSVVEVFGQDLSDEVHLTAPMIGVDYLGQEVSPFIGPSNNWKNFYWKIDAQESLAGDTTTLEIESYDYNKNFVSTIPVTLNSTDSILNLESIIQSATTPYLKLRSTTIDSVHITPGQMDRWHVLYDEYPEAAIDGTNGFLWTAVADTINEGETIQFAIDVRNIHNVDMDSLLIQYYIEDENNVKHLLEYPRQDSLRVNQTLRDTIEFSTTGYPGKNLFWMEVNPYTGPGNTTDQPEQYHFNNLLQIPFNVRTDNENPLLDVTFDGRHILNGDIVSPLSEILITLKDDNPLLLMDDIADTSLFGIYLTNPNGIQKRIPFESATGSVMYWIPADAQTRRFKITYPAEFELDGKYTLLVQGSDKSGNLSGDLEYRISFEVIRESSITQLMNYPNPFSTSTRFVFTLTGTEVPDDMIIQIMTTTGRVVREITEMEFGPMNIGRNISEFEWDGTDEFGDQLANGVYLYRVRMKLNGEMMNHRDSGADKYFTKDFGKMYLLR